jgi:hypothetical protein
MAIPERATIFASIPILRITMNVNRTPTGNILEITIDALKFNTSTITTIMVISISRDREFSRVPIVSWINPVLS